MASTDLYALSHSALNTFLYADIGPQDGAGSLTIASLFGRSGCDPWEEAARLARLPAGAAAASLAARIVALPTSPWSLPEATALAGQLVALLPRTTAADRIAAVRSVPRWPLGALPTGALALGVVVALALAWSILADGTGPRGTQDGARSTDPVAQETPRR